MPLSHAAGVGLLALGVGTIGAVAVASAGKTTTTTPPGSKPGKITISVTPVSFPDGGGTAMVTGSSKNFAEGTIVTLYDGPAGGKETTTDGSIGADGSFSITYDVAANTTKKAKAEVLDCRAVDGLGKTRVSNKITLSIAAA